MSDKNKIKFLLIVNSIEFFWSHRLQLAQAIEKKFGGIDIAIPAADKDPQFKKYNFTGHDLPTVGRGSDIWGQIKLMWALFKTIQKTQPDIIHTITIRHAFYVGIVARLIGFKPCVYTVAGLGSLYTAPGLKPKIIRALTIPLMMFAFRGAGRFMIFQNPDDLNAMLDAKIVTQDQATIIRGSGVDITQFSFDVYEDKKDEEPIILFASRLIREKGIYDFIQAARILKKKGVKARFQVAGDIYPDNARSLTLPEMEELQAEGVIEWLGQVKDMPALIKKSMMMVLPSYYGEGLPKILLEAAAIGRPIITCDAPGCREAVEHEVNGELILPQCPTDLARAIEKLINDPERRHCYGAAGRKRVEAEFHVDNVVAQTIAVYDKLLKEL